MDENVKIFVSHYRYDDSGQLRRYLRSKSNDFEPSPFGGQTVVEIVDSDGKELLAVGQSHCSQLDQFNYKLGRKIAFGRALKILKEGMPQVD